MWRYYLRLLKRLPRHIYEATDNLLTALAVLTFLLVLLNKDWLTALDKAAAGISRAWALVPVGLFVLYALLEANYEHVEDKSVRPSPDELARELDDFLAATQARIPAFRLDMQLIFEDRAAASRLNAERNARVAEIQAEALGEYYSRFRHLVIEAVRADARAVALARTPEHLGHLHQLVKALRGEAWQGDENDA